MEEELVVDGLEHHIESIHLVCQAIQIMLCLIIVLYLKDLTLIVHSSAIATPSLNAMFHAFTFMYIVLAVEV